MSGVLLDRLQELLDALEDAVLLVDGLSASGQQIVGSNASARALLGYSEDELKAITTADLRVPGDARGPQAYETRRVGGRFEGGVGVRRKDGTAFEAQVRSVSLTTIDGRGLVGIVVHDLTPQRRLDEASAALADSEALLRALADAAFEAVFIHAGGVIITANRAAEVLAGVERGGFAGRPLMDFLAPESRAEVHERIRAGDERPYQIVVLRDDGTPLPAEVQARNTPVVVQGRPARVVAMRDLSERLALEEQVRQVQKMEAIGRLAGGVAHDFNNLLSVIISAATTARSVLGTAHPAAVDLADVLDASERAATLTKQLLAFGRKQVLQPRVVELDAAVHRLEPMFRRLIPENITLAVEPGAPGAHVRIDSSQLEVSLMNLVVNARDAMPVGGTLTIGTCVADLDEAHPRARAFGRSGPHALLVVSDTGRGMDARTLERVFEPFFTTRAEAGGTGLGLATVFGAVRQAGGAIWADSTPGHGARFTIALPRVQEQAPVATVEAQREALPVGHTILLVEDEGALRKVTGRLLRSAGYQVLEAANGAEALALVERHAGPLHLLLTDMVMPGLDGRQVAAAVKARRPDVKVLIVSGYSEHPLGEGDAAEAFLPKPVPPGTLLAKVAELLR